MVDRYRNLLDFTPEAPPGHFHSAAKIQIRSLEQNYPNKNYSDAPRPDLRRAHAHTNGARRNWSVGVIEYCIPNLSLHRSGTPTPTRGSSAPS
jgi:hypothetical protein